MTSASSAQSSESPEDPQQIVSAWDGFAITVPASWQQEDPQADFTVAVYDPDTQSRCMAKTELDAGPLEARVAGFADFLREQAFFDEVSEPRPVDLPAGEAFVVDSEASRSDLAASADYHVWADGIVGQIGCFGPERPEDDWLSIVETFEFLGMDDATELGWPDVPLAEQQTWERISEVPGIARRQLLHIRRTDQPDVRWYIHCMDRMHERVAPDSNDTSVKNILAIIAGGDACWATRNPESEEWDFSTWTDPIEAALVGATTNKYEWECTVPGGEVQPWVTEDDQVPEPFREFPEICSLVKEPGE